MLRRKGVYFVIAVFAVASLPLPASAYENNYTDNQVEECRFRRNNRWSRAESKDSIRCAYRRLNRNDLNAGMRIADDESGFNTYAENPSSTAGGLFQYLSSTWSGTVQRFREVVRRWDLHPKKHNARAQAFLTARKMKSDGCGAWAASGNGSLC